MFCEECKQRPATVYLTKIQNGKVTEMRLCEECARKSHEFPFSLEPNYSLHKLLAGLLEGVPFEVAPEATLQCPSCHLTYARFSELGRFGCSKCYSAFGKRLEPLLRRIHGSNRHTGKVPRRAGENLWRRREIERLRAELEQAVREERYERAAELRDRIRALEGKSEQR